MYDDHIKSRLIKDWRFFKENHLNTDQKVHALHVVIIEMSITQKDQWYQQQILKACPSFSTHSSGQTSSTKELENLESTQMG